MPSLNLHPPQYAKFKLHLPPQYAKFKSIPHHNMPRLNLHLPPQYAKFKSTSPTPICQV